MNKHELVKQYMLDGNSITSWEAIEKFGATRLSAIIFNLKNTYNIVSTREEHIDRYGNSGHYARYRIIGERNIDQEALEILKGLE
jgi:hypothetical protein